MYKNTYRVTLLLIVAALVMFLVFSCGDDSDSGNNSTMTLGDPNQLEFVQMQEDVEGLLFMGSMFVGMGADKANGFDSTVFFELGSKIGKLAGAQSDSIAIYYASGDWWVAYFSVTENDSEFSFELLMRDSVQYRSITGTPQMYPDENTDYFHNITRIELGFQSDSAGSVSFDAYSNLKFEGLQSDDLEVNGNLQISIEGDFIDEQGSDVSGTASIGLQITGLTVPNSDEHNGEACPTSGTIVFNYAEDYYSELAGDGSQVSSWQVTVTVLNEDTYKVKITSGNVEWDEYTVTGVCGTGYVPQVVYQAISRMAKR